MKKHTVKQGECISSIALKYGLFWETLWNFPENAELKEKRGDPSILLPGDVVVVPDMVKKSVTVSTEKTYKFIKKSVPFKISLRFLEVGESRSNEKYKIKFDTTEIVDNLDDDGYLVQKIPPDVNECTLLLGEEEEYILEVGNLDPVTEVTGVQGMLKNLGYYDGDIDGKPGKFTEAAISAFQTASGLEATGSADQKTMDALKKSHGS